MKQVVAICLRVIIPGLLTVGFLLDAAESSPPRWGAYLRCLRPVTYSYRISTTAAGDLAQETIVLEESLANAGVPEPSVEIRRGLADIHTYAASEPDAERLDQLIRIELGRRYPGYRPNGGPRFTGSPDYAQQALDVVTARLRSAGYRDGQSGLLGPNQFWVSVQTADRDLAWAWERRGLFEIRLLPRGCSISVGRSDPSASPWRPAEGTQAFDAQNRMVEFVPLVRRSTLAASNNPPLDEARVEEADYQALVKWRLTPSAAARMKEITSRSLGRAIALVWDGIVIAAPTIRAPTGAEFIIEGRFWDDVGHRATKQLAACLTSGPTPTPVIAMPPKVEIPKSVSYFLSEAYPRWRLLTYEDYGPSQWAARIAKLRETPTYGKDYHPFAVQGDFDGNGTTDWALLLKSEDGVRLVALHHAGTTWKPHVISEISYQAGFAAGMPGFGSYLEPARAGQFRGDFHRGRLLPLPRDGIEAVFAEDAAWLWLWDGDRYSRFASRN
jgi:hypothetical protein